MRTFDYSFLKDGMVPSKFVSIVANIYALRERARRRMKDHPSLFEKLKNTSEFRSIKGSNAIEGIYSDDTRIRWLMAGIDEPRTKDEKAIAGYMDAFRQVDKDFKRLDFCEKDILSLHKTLLSHTDEDFGGQYKQRDNVIVEIDYLGNRKVRYVPMSAKETPEAMEQLWLAFMDARSEYAINSLLLIPCVILDFLCVHPFLDGNGRVSRLLSLLLLYKEGFEIGRYISFEMAIYKHRAFYYGSIEASQKGWDNNENDYFPFVEDFLTDLADCYRDLDRMFEVEESNGDFSKKARIEWEVLNHLGTISKKEICDALPDVSMSTVEVVLSQMLKEGKIEKVGSTINCRYARKHD